jgi:hypothetical protein
VPREIGDAGIAVHLEQFLRIGVAVAVGVGDDGVGLEELDLEGIRDAVAVRILIGRIAVDDVVLLVVAQLIAVAST